MKKIILTFIVALLCTAALKAENGHDLWLRKRQANPVNVVSAKQSPTLELAKQELLENWQGKAGATVRLVVKRDKDIKGDGFRINAGVIQANTDLGILYGVFELLRRVETGEPTENILSNPSYSRRILNHWDNLNGSMEHGFGGNSIFWRNEKDAPTVTDADKKLWREYARANASIGINGSVINNVNASPAVLSAPYLAKVKAVAEALRPYGIRVYLSVNFASPIKLSGFKTADPLDPEVIKWWQAKVKEIYAGIPDFGGFLVKANSEGQPGPQDYKRTHAEGANMMADILKPYGGIVMWRAFVYSATDPDRARQAYSEFTPLDGKFRDNVIIQVKNGPIDFQPREPFSPLFGALKQTSIAPEFQITQEYLGHAIQLVFLSSMWEECLKSDTYQDGPGSTVARCTDGSIFPQKYTAIAGVANIGLDSNWCGHPFAQANWYAFGRLAWDNTLTSDQIAQEWLMQTFSPLSTKESLGTSTTAWHNGFLLPVKKMMLESREAVVNYSMPLGLHHIFSVFEHYGPGPWYAPKNVRPDWTPPYYHKAAADGIGFDRTTTGSNAVSQYQEPLRSTFASLNDCPEIYLLWFHHLPWDYKTKNGRTLWDALCYHYQDGVTAVRGFQKTWDGIKPFIDNERFADIQARLRRQSRDAQVWKDGCLQYFQQFSNLPLPPDVERPVNDLKYLQSVPPLGIR